MARDYTSQTINTHGIETHYLEAGIENDETVVLIHSGEYGASAEMSWFRNIPALAEDYHVLAPDLLGYGGTDKVFDFEDMYDRRIQHISQFLDIMNVDEAYFVGNSMGAGYLASLACEPAPLDWPIRKMVLISGGGQTPPEFIDIIKEFDGTRDGMERIIDTLYYDPATLGEDFIEKKVQNSRVSGHWQSLSAIRFEPPFEQEQEFRRQYDFENVDVPTFIIGGENDELHPKEELVEVAEEIGAQTEFLDECKHSAHIEYPDRINQLIFDFFD